MTNVYSMQGMLTLVLLFICSCAYIRRVPRLRSLVSPQPGPLGVFYKAALIGRRLHWCVSIACLSMAAYLVIG
ncbi:unnamed protein product [Phaeothamnion confervicola]